MCIFKMLSLLILAAVFAQSAAQLEVFGSPKSFDSNGLYSQEVLPVHVMQTVNVADLMAEDANEPKDVPFRFAFPLQTNLSAATHGKWISEDVEGNIWRLRIACPGATSIGLVFKKFRLPSKAKLFVYDDHRTHVLGAFTSLNNKPSGSFSIRPVPSDSITIEYNSPPASSASELTLELSHINYGYRDLAVVRETNLLTAFSSSGSCNVNVVCKLGRRMGDQINAVAMILTAGGTRLCSGAMVNNVRKDGRQLFLTANHCGTDVDNWIFLFDYRSDVCPFPGSDGRLDLSVQGATQLARRAESDFSLLEVAEPIPTDYGVFLAGWSADPAPATLVHGLHHPSGDVMKVSVYDGTLESDGWTAWENGTHWRVPAWSAPGQGQEPTTTEPGSSGSPLFNSDGQIIGQLHGGTASCLSNSYDLYGGCPRTTNGVLLGSGIVAVREGWRVWWAGKVAVSWDGGATPEEKLQPWLDPGVGR